MYMGAPPLFNSIRFFPSQIALITGNSQRDIYDWINKGYLKAEHKERFYWIVLGDLIQFLYNYPEYVGRIYCSDIPGLINDYRKYIVNELEKMFENGYI